MINGHSVSKFRAREKVARGRDVYEARTVETPADCGTGPAGLNQQGQCRGPGCEFLPNPGFY